MSIEDAFKFLQDHPNVKFALAAIQKLISLQTPIEKMVVIITMSNEGAGSFLIERDKNKPLSEKAKINLLFRFCDELNLPTAYLNLEMDSEKLRLKGVPENA